jgi:hypothetical protein
MREIDSVPLVTIERRTERPTRQNLKKGRSFPVQMHLNRNRSTAKAGGSRRVIWARLMAGLALACAALEPATASTVRMVCLVVDLEGDGLRLGDRHYPVPFDVDGDGLRERVQWTAEEQREGFLWLDADHDDAMQSDELLGRRLATPDGPSRQAGWRALADLDSVDAGGDGDGQLTATDRAWADLRLWIDYNHDGDPDRVELYSLEDWRIESFALDFAEGLKVDGGLNLETAWASVTVRPRSGSSSSGGAGVVTEVHLPLLSAPTAAAGTPVPLA